MRGISLSGLSLLYLVNCAINLGGVSALLESRVEKLSRLTSPNSSTEHSLSACKVFCAMALRKIFFPLATLSQNGSNN